MGKFVKQQWTLLGQEMIFYWLWYTMYKIQVKLQYIKSDTSHKITMKSTMKQNFLDGRSVVGCRTGQP